MSANPPPESPSNLIKLGDNVTFSPETAAELLNLCGGRLLKDVMDYLGYILADDGGEEGGPHF